MNKTKYPYSTMPVGTWVNLWFPTPQAVRLARNMAHTTGDKRGKKFKTQLIPDSNRVIVERVA
jgi:hypothetical protein